MKRLLYLGSVLLLAALLVGACSDDDCPTCPDSSQIGVVYGVVSVRTTYQDTLTAFAYIFPTNKPDITIDSVLVDGNRGEIMYESEGPIPIIIFQYRSMVMENSYVSGDNVVLEFFAPQGTSRCTTQVLNDSLDMPLVIGWDLDYPYDNFVNSDLSFPVHWRAVPNADWFQINVGREYYVGGVEHDTSYTLIVTDTTFTVVPDGADSGSYYFNITAGTGPSRHAASGNLRGGVLKGLMNGLSRGESFTIYTGDYPIPILRSNEQPMEDINNDPWALLRMIHGL
ncbi:MAG: hypothetical protein KKA42_16740 [candidate division Zixibacteria bacterium]|nr:hypothetical protein [candidate division Zixibacteria bacterium]